MPFNGSGTFTPSVNWTTEAASPPIEISKLDSQASDVATGLSNCQTLDGQSSPTADLPMNGHKHTNVSAATALTHYARLSELIDQDHVFWVDSGSANTYAITPSPAIAAYEEGQRFVVRIANASSGASTLNVNGLGAVAIQLVDGSALTTGTRAAGGIYEFTYDANTTPDRWVLTSPASEIPDGMLSSNVPLKDATNTFSIRQDITHNGADWSGTAGLVITNNSTGSATNFYLNATNGTDADWQIGISETDAATPTVTVGPSVSATVKYNGDIHDFQTGSVLAATIANSTSTTLVAGQLHFVTGDATLPNLTAGQWIEIINDSGSSITISKNGSDTTYWTATGASVSTSFTLAARGRLSAVCSPAGSVVYVSGNISAAT